MKLSAHFSSDEFKCRDGSKVPVEYLGNLKALVMVLERIRKEFQKPIKIISGYRTPEYNARVGGSKKSRHMTAEAADIIIDGVTSSEIAIKIQGLMAEGEILIGGCGLYPGRFVHVDVRGGKKPVRWEG